jgi:hypothetical protein
MTDSIKSPLSNNQPEPTMAIRLIFEYEGEQVRLVSQQLVNLAITETDTFRMENDGIYVDARNAEGETLARVPTHKALQKSLEVFPEKHGDPIVRMETKKPKGAFTVVIPSLTAAKKVSVVRISSTKTAALRKGIPATRAIEVVDLASFPLNSKP